MFNLDEVRADATSVEAVSKTLVLPAVTLWEALLPKLSVVDESGLAKVCEDELAL